MPFSIDPRKINRRAYRDGRSVVDGFLCDGWRRVSKRGSVRFHGYAWQDDELLQYAGLWVLVQNGDCWGGCIEIYPDGWMTSQLRKIFVDKPEGYVEREV